jgi:hypothetical protein
MEWFVRYRKPGGPDSIVEAPTPEEAISIACTLLDSGLEVFGIGTGSLGDSIETDQIALIYEMWKRADGLRRRT